MKLATPKFNRKDHPEFFKVLNQRVNSYFSDNNLSKKANAPMVLKTIFMVSLYFIPFAILLSGVNISFWFIMSMWALMGLGMAGIGLSVMHDANHGSYSTNQNVNKLVGFIINFMGAYHGTWKIQHNVLHHSYTNIEGYDEDTDNNIMRFSPIRSKSPLFRFQAYYAPFLYCLMSFNRFLVKDFKQLFTFNKAGLLKSQNMGFWSTFGKIVFNKIWYVLLTIALPIYLLPVSAWWIIGGFFLMHSICGIILALVFQCAHIIEETHFYEPAEDDESMENSWAIHQLKTTANFANTSTIFSWLIGGLNYQIEHHLFPNICHVHYKNISGIVKSTTHEYDLPYHQHVTFYGALKSHFSYLDQLGRGVV